ncbi:MAG: TldD protein [Alphaproteobacteria bacterium]|jgi:TldD protein
MSSKILNALGRNSDELSTLVQNALTGGNGGELYMTEVRSFSLSMSKGIIGTSTPAIIKGGSVRRINGIATPFVTFDGFADASLIKALITIEKTPQDVATQLHLKAAGQYGTQPYYTQDDVFEGAAFDVFHQQAITLLQEMNAYARRDARVENVGISVSVAGKDILIARADGKVLTDYRPTCQLSINVVLKDGSKKESSGENFGLPMTISQAFAVEATWQKMIDDSIRKAGNNLTAIEATAGNDFEVIFCPGFAGGVVLHEAFGHALEGDFHAKGNSAFQGKLGKRIAAKGVNVYEDGTVFSARGSYNFDDEGNPSNKNLLVDDGILVGLMTDEKSAAELGMALTGNGRRQSYMHQPMPRMSNTYMAAGDSSVDNLISNVTKGYYVEELNGGQVDIVSSKFVQNGTQVRMIENGKLGAYVKGVSFAGMGNESYKHIIGIANDFEISKNGSCGKDGQSVPVTAGQASMLFAKGALKVGGTA